IPAPAVVGRERSDVDDGSSRVVQSFADFGGGDRAHRWYLMRDAGGKQKPLSEQGCDATFGVLDTRFARLGTPPALHGRGSTRTMHGVRPRIHRSRIVTSTYATVQDLRPRRSGIGSVPSGPALSRSVRFGE